MVRLVSALLLGPLGPCNFSLKTTLLTIKYLYNARTKVIIVTGWDTVLQSNNPAIKSTESFAEASFRCCNICQRFFLAVA
uniref:Uncharacterized protein n=1 Tax=Arundo donax TaxID=35708 RepID=A0A0A9GII3_ARUDO